MSFESIEEIIGYAIEKEKEAAEFYEDCSKQEFFSGSKDIVSINAFYLAGQRVGNFGIW